MREIIINKDSFLFNRVKEPLLNGERQPMCFEAHVSPRSFAEPTQGKPLIGVAALWDKPKARLEEGEVEYEGYACRWVTGLVRLEIDSGVECPACKALDTIKYNSGIEKLWCCECGVDVSKL